MKFFDNLEIRSSDERQSSISQLLPEQITKAQTLGSLEGIDPSQIKGVDDLPRLPVFRKSELIEKQKSNPPFGGLVGGRVEHFFQSPGPIYEPGKTSRDWWRCGRFINACGIGKKDIVQNCFSYHLTPAGMMFENGAHAVGAAVLPAGTGNTELQVQAASHLDVTAYAGTPDYLKTILEKADEMGIKLNYSKAAVSGGALFPSLRDFYSNQGIECLQSYGTAELGCIAYESNEKTGMIIEEGVIIEIVTPGTGNPVKLGEVGEVLVTTLGSDYPLIRFATGDMSAIMSGQSSCGRTNTRIKGWMGRADQTTKIKGMFVRPEQVAELVKRHKEIVKARVVVKRDRDQDRMVVKLESLDKMNLGYTDSIQNIFRINGDVEVYAEGELPIDGLVIEDLRKYE